MGVEVVGEDRPAAPGLLAGAPGQAAAAQPVAAFEVADAALRAGAVAVQASAGAGRVGLLTAGDVHGGGGLVASVDRVLGAGGAEAAVDGELADHEAERVRLASVPGSSSFSPGFPGAVVGGRM